MLKFHENQLKNGESQRNKSLEIADALGGIDEILRDYLDETKYPHSHLTKNELTKLHQILLSNNTSTKIVVAPTNKDKYKESGNVIIYDFDENDSFLNHLFPEKYAKKIEKIDIKRESLMGGM